MCAIDSRMRFWWGALFENYKLFNSMDLFPTMQVQSDRSYK